MKSYFVYIMMNDGNTVNYTGVTSNLFERIYKHKNKLLKGFTSKYNINKLVYFEECYSVDDAIAREKEIKGWRREKKIKLISGDNPDFNDLSKGWY